MEPKIVLFIENRFREGQEIIINVSESGRNKVSSIGNTTYIKVTPREYHLAVAKLEQLKEEQSLQDEKRKREEKAKNDKFDSEDYEIEEILLKKQAIQKNNRITRQVKNANNMSINEYKRSVTNPEKEKRAIKGVKVFENAKKFIAVGVATLLVAGGIGAGVWEVTKGPEYRETAAERILQVVKDELDADKIYDNSAILGSNRVKEHFIVEKDGKIYQYKADIYTGERPDVEIDELDEETRKAISIAASAQNGNTFDAIKANKYADKIEKGEINLSIDEKVVVHDDEGR